MSRTARLLHGRLQLRDRRFFDDRGPVLPVFCHFGEAFSAFVRRPDDVRRQLDAIAAAGYHGIRFWDVLGYYDDPWAGREITPVSFPNRQGHRVAATPRYYEQLAAFLLACHERSLKVMHDRGDLNAWSDEQKLAHMRRLGAMYRAGGETGRVVLGGLWACNEGYQNGVTTPEEAIAMLRAFEEGAGWLPDARGLSAPDGAELHDLRAWSADPATVVTIHSYRGAGAHHRIRHVFSNGYERCALIGKAGWNTEPIGPGPLVSVGREEDPAVLVAMAVVSLLSTQAWTYMSSPGVQWHGPIHEQPAFASVGRLAGSLPPDLMTFDIVADSGPAWRRVRPLVAEGENRFDFALHSDGRFVGVAYGPALGELTVARAGRFAVVDPATLETLSETDRAPGERLPLSGPARLVMGRLTLDDNKA